MPIEKLTAADPETQSPDRAKENLAALRALFPAGDWGDPNRLENLGLGAIFPACSRGDD
jgi:hypothetical protein